MSECSPYQDALRVATAERSSICDRILVGLVLLALVRAGEALAGDQASAAAVARKPDQSDLRQPASFTSSLFAAPEISPLPSLPETKSFSAKDFRPRGQSIAVSDPRLKVVDDALIDDTTVWQRLEEYRTRDRVRLLTLWQSGASSVSLQAGKRGDPTLQWTSRLTNGGGAMRSLLDRLFPVTAFGESKDARGVARPITAQPAAKGSTSLGALRFEPPASP
ncbi:MAG: hypothetical protein ACLP2F_02540 [Steroidobacteraceae bacterium]